MIPDIPQNDFLLMIPRYPRKSCEANNLEHFRSILTRVIKWSNENNMKLHEQKFELVVHRANPGLLLHELPFTSDTWTYSVSDEQKLLPVEELRDLGVIVTEKLPWSLNIHSLIMKNTAMAPWVLSVFKSRDRLVMLTLYKSLVRSHIEYCCTL